DKHRHAQLMPEVILLALLEEKGTAAEQLLTKFVLERGVELERLIRKVALSIDTRRDQNGNLDFVARENRLVPMSRQTIIMVDDVLNTGKILTYSMKPFLSTEVKKIEVAVLVNRSHLMFPVHPRYTGYALSTTLSEHIEVILGKKSAVYLH
ncbi:MAG: Clp protease N-terminal domain-containing protein, partial [Bacteroidota bacterium]